MSQQQGNVFSSEYEAANREQATKLKPEASEHGLQLDTYLVPSVAKWVLERVENGHFLTPSEAVFAAMQVFMGLEDHPDRREELFRRELQKSFDDPGPGIHREEALARIMKRMKASQGTTPPTWIKIPPTE